VAELNAELTAIYRTFPDLRMGTKARPAGRKRKRAAMTAAQEGGGIEADEGVLGGEESEEEPLVMNQGAVPSLCFGRGSNRGHR
jgi:hypothetical protein